MEYLQSLQNSDSFVENLYINYKKFILSVIVRYIADPSLQEDIFHEVFVRILRRADFLSTLPPYKLETYLLLMARGVSIDFLRKNHFNQQCDLSDDIILELIDEQRFSANRSVDPIAKADLKMMLQYISPEDLALLIGKYYLELDAKELATIGGLSSTAVRSRIHRAKNKLLDKWKADGLTMEDFIHG